jgi:hypothetical protein
LQNRKVTIKIIEMDETGRQRINVLRSGMAFIGCLLLIFLLSFCGRKTESEIPTENYPAINPDYINVTIPYNIAPLNFKMTDSCSKINVTISGRAYSIRISGDYKIKIPLTKWKKLLDEQKNDSVIVSVTALQKGKWVKYKPFAFHISADRIDPFLSYRLIEPGYEVYHRLQLCERDLENFRERVIADNNMLDGACFNCHIYSSQQPSLSFFHLRQKNGGTMIQVNGSFRKINTKTDSTISAGVYGSWHPSGRYLVFSTNVIIPEFHSINNLRIEVYDTVSDVVVLDIQKNTIIKNPLLSEKNSFETFPAFSSDGRKIYFCSARALRMPENYKAIKYSLCSIDFDPSAGTIGKAIDTLVSSWRTGRTLSEPKPSPDGKYILFTSFAYGNFPVWHKEADLHLLKLSDLSVDTIPVVNSDSPDSYHSWASDSRWFVFASKRGDGMYGKPYFAHIDESGRCSKPFLLPQKNADFYEYFLKSYNIPELSVGPVPFGPADVERAFRKLKAEKVSLAK